MKREDCSTEKVKYKHLNERDRYKLEGLLKGKKKIGEIAKELKRNRSTIYLEINRGTIKRRQYDWSEKEEYRANVAQADYEAKGANKERGLKIGKDKKLEEHIRKRLLKDKFSPDAIIGEIRVKEIKFESQICTKTLYNYIEAGIFSGISNKDLWQKRHKKKRKYRVISRVNTKNRECRSIEDRSETINNRLEYGHWEGDTVKGSRGTKGGLLTLTERRTREEIIIKLKRANQEYVKKALDKLEKKYGVEFKIKFKSITFDNGVEFLNWKYLEVSLLVKGEQRTTIYFAHSYSSWERGTNENQNRMIRRFIPKGTDIADFSDKEIQRIEDWMNNYPRKILGYRTANQMVQECLQGKSFWKRSKVVGL